MRGEVRRFRLSTALLIGALALGTAGLGATESEAAGLNPFGPAGLPLTEQDYAAMAKAADPLLNDDTIALGTTRDWSNPTSGNKGSITLMERFEYTYEGNKLPCRKLKYRAVIQNLADPYNLVIQRCRIANGEWKLL
jgi:hypothetical protein